MEQRPRFRSPPIDDLVRQIDAELRPKIAPFPGMGLQPEKAEVAQVRAGDQYVRFFLANILLAAPLESAREIGRMPRVTKLPNLPDWILGVSNIRGEIVSVVDLRGFFGLEGVPGDPGAWAGKMFIILSREEMKVGVVVDRVAGILYLDTRKTGLQKPPYREGDPEKKLVPFIRGLIPLSRIPEGGNEKRLLHLLDVDRLLTARRMTAFRT